MTPISARKRGARSSKPVTAVDDSFLASSEQETEGTMPVLNLKDAYANRVCMEVVPRKGTNNYAVEVFSILSRLWGTTNALSRVIRRQL